MTSSSSAPPVEIRRAVMAILEMDGEDALAQLRRHLPNATIFLLTAQPGSSDGKLVAAEQVVSALEAWAGPDQTLHLSPMLTPRQQDILDLIVQGKSNKEIARALAISPFTVRNHVSLLLRVLNVASREEAASKATEGATLRQ
ncbi:response regulator transcription factor [Labrys sp. KNU-23]|uniref:response regulator transcription factor n=1 Tax=Labrys sp. KNU-23 TaxID=2789216 RepID=UPI001FF037A7|nr:LuxR C-terminal-related transcriptional regulator [Labrys sp. KNU-23]